MNELLFKKNFNNIYEHLFFDKSLDESIFNFCKENKTYYILSFPTIYDDNKKLDKLLNIYIKSFTNAIEESIKEKEIAKILDKFLSRNFLIFYSAKSDLLVSFLKNLIVITKKHENEHLQNFIFKIFNVFFENNKDELSSLLNPGVVFSKNQNFEFFNFLYNDNKSNIYKLNITNYIAKKELIKNLDISFFENPKNKDFIFNLLGIKIQNNIKNSQSILLTDIIIFESQYLNDIFKAIALPLPINKTISILSLLHQNKNLNIKFKEDGLYQIFSNIISGYISFRSLDNNLFLKNTEVKNYFKKYIFTNINKLNFKTFNLSTYESIVFSNIKEMSEEEKINNIINFCLMYNLSKKSRLKTHSIDKVINFDILNKNEDLNKIFIYLLISNPLFFSKDKETLKKINFYSILKKYSKQELEDFVAHKTKEIFKIDINKEVKQNKVKK